MANRWIKISLVFSAGLFSIIVAFNNITDYQSNYLFVSHVLSMDDTFPDNKGMWRAISNAGVHHLFYWMIILTECLIGMLCLMGAYKLIKNRKDAAPFQAAKGLAIVGLGLGIVLWFLGFITIGGEWFLMWQSQSWNGQQSAFRIAALFGIFLIYLNQPD